MLLKTFEHNKNDFYAGLIFAIVIVSAYGPVIFLEQTVMINTPIPPQYLENQKKTTLFGITVDYSTPAVYPDIKLASKMISEGELPLWNPYIGIGYPLGADTTHHIFSPINLGFLFSSEYWDLPVLLVLWVAGFTTFIFLRNLGLNFTSSIGGGIFYMLSGAFTWYIVNPNPFVTMVTPLILFSIDKIFKNKNPKYIILLSFSLGFSILGAHLQSLLLQFLLAISYFIYRNLTIFFINKNTLENYSLKHNFLIITKSSSKVILGLMGGFGLTSFYILYVLEYLQNGILEKALTYGSVQWNTITLATIAIPNILGNITRTWTTNVEWASYFGHVGAFALFFAAISIFYIKKKNYRERFTPIFFLFMAFLVLIRLSNMPLISELTTLPLLDLISLSAYSGVIITFGFTVAAAFGINYICNENISKKKIFIASIVSISIISILLVPTIIEFLSNENLSHFIPVSDIQNYISFQIIQFVFFISMALIISIVLRKKMHFITILPMFFLLELSLYLPFGLHPISIAYKFVLIVFAMIILILLTNFFRVNTNKQKKVFWSIVFVIMIGVSIGNIIISEKSEYGMPTRYDSFGEHEVINFLQNNLIHQRMFSFDDTMRSDYNAGFGISSVGVFSSFGVNDYHMFAEKFLDEDVRPLGLGSSPWSNFYGPEKSIDKFLDHKKYFDFLGVKYIITQGYNLNSVSYGVSGLAGNHIILNSEQDKIEQKFISTVNSIESLGIFLFGMNLQDNEQIILTIDSIPYSEENHRTSVISQVRNSAINEFKILPPIMNSLDKNFKFSLEYPKSSDDKYLVLYFDKKNLSDLDIELAVNSKEEKDKFIPFVITPVEKDFPVPFNFHDIFVNENLNAFPRAFLVHDFKTVPVDSAQNFLDKNNNFDLRNNVILESSLLKYELNNLKSKSVESDTVKIIEFNENNIKIQSFSENDSILILTDVYYPGWQVIVDGESSEILRANGLVRAVVLEEGSHIIEFNYVPESFWNGIIVSIITLICLFGVYLYSKKFHKINVLKNENTLN